MNFPFTHIRAGDTHSGSYSNADYPASDGWTLTYILSGPSRVTTTATSVGDIYNVELTAAQSNVLSAGLYNYTLRVALNTKVYTLKTGVVDVRPNPTTVANKVFVAQRMIELIEKALENQLTDGDAIESLSISGRSLTSVNRTELIQEWGYWKNQLSQYRNAVNGLSPLRQVPLTSIGRL